MRKITLGFLAAGFAVSTFAAPAAKDTVPGSCLRYWWNFENSTTFLTDALGREKNNAITRSSETGVVWKGDEAKYGAGSAFLGNGHLELPVPSFMDQTASKGFTVAFWFKSSLKSLSESAAGKKDAVNRGARIFYFGKKGANPTETEQISLFYNVLTDLISDKFKYRDAFGPISVGADFPVADWVHVGVVVMPVAKEKQVDGKNARVKIYINGEMRRMKDFVFDAGSAPVLCLGSGYARQGLLDIKCSHFDQIMIFNRALTQAQVKHYSELEKPL